MLGVLGNMINAVSGCTFSWKSQPDSFLYCTSTLHIQRGDWGLLSRFHQLQTGQTQNDIYCIKNILGWIFVMSLFCTILVLEKSFSKESAIFCTAANWASISVRWEENQAVEGLGEARWGATTWLFISLQISDFTSSALTPSEFGSMWLSHGNSSPSV